MSREIIQAADQIAGGQLTLDDESIVAIPRDNLFDRDPTKPLVVVQLLDENYYSNPRQPVNLLVIEREGRVYLCRVSYMAHARFRNSRGVKAEQNVMVRFMDTPLFRVAGEDTESTGVILKYQTFVRTMPLLGTLLTADQETSKSAQLSPATFYFRANVSPQSSLVIQPARRPIAPAQNAAARLVYMLPMVASNLERRLNQGRLACIETLRNRKVRLASGRVAYMPYNAAFSSMPPKQHYPCILIQMLQEDFTTMMNESVPKLFGVYVIVPGASINWTLMDEDMWYEWAMHRDSTSDRTIIYHRLMDKVDGVEQLKLHLSPDPEGRAVVEMHLKIRMEDRANYLPLGQADPHYTSGPWSNFAVLPPVSPDYLVQPAQVFFPIVMQKERSRTSGIYRWGFGGSMANNWFIFEDVEIPSWGPNQWQTENIFEEMMPPLPDPGIQTISEYVDWIAEKWAAIRPNLGPLIAEIAVAYISPGNQHVFVAHSGQRAVVSPLLYYAVQEAPSGFVQMTGLMIHPSWTGLIRQIDGNVIELEQPIGEIATRSAQSSPIVPVLSLSSPPSGTPGALSDVQSWQMLVRKQYLESDINNLSLLHDIVVGIETEDYKWTIISDDRERFVVSGLVFQLVFMFAHTAVEPFVSMNGFWFREDWWKRAREITANSIRFDEPLGLIRVRTMRRNDANKRLRGEAWAK